MRLIAVNHVADTDRREALPPEYDVWETRRPIGETYYRIAQQAVWENWGTETVVIQDDVRLAVTPEPSTHDLILYGDYKSLPMHACPRAFAASHEMWKGLEQRWSSTPNRLCDTFLGALRATESIEIILGGAEHLEEPGSRPWPRELP